MSNRAADPSPFLYVDSVSQTKVDVLGTVGVSGYRPFIVNRALSYHPDAVLFADEMNTRPGASLDMQYYYYLHSLRPRRRFAKWHKDARIEEENMIMRAYGYNRARARETLSVLTHEQLEWARRATRGMDE